MPWIGATLAHAVLRGLLFWFFLRLSGLRSVPNTAGAGRTTTMQTSTTSTKGTPSSTRRQSASMANTQQRSNRTWREEQPSSLSRHLSDFFFLDTFFFFFLLMFLSNLKSPLIGGFDLTCISYNILSSVTLYSIKP